MYDVLNLIIGHANLHIYGKPHFGIQTTREKQFI